MKKLLFIFTALLFAATSRAQSDLIARIHFAGADKISSDTNSVAFTNEFCSAEARALERQTLDKLSRAPGVWFRDKLPMGAGDGSAQLRPLLDDFLKSEWVFEMRDAPASQEYALAIRLTGDRAQLWSRNLQGLLESWEKIPSQKTRTGWALKKHEPPNLFCFVRAGDWAVIGCGQDELPLIGELVQGEHFPENEKNWLSADLDWPRLAKLFPALAKFDFPKIAVQIAGRGGELRLTGKFILSQPLPPLEQWQIPTNAIHQPLTSFTAVRGFAPWLERQPWAQPFMLSPVPDELFTWSLGLMPLQTFIAAPAPDAPDALAQLGQNLAAHTNWQSHLMSPFEMDRTSNRISWKGFPFIAPEVEMLREPSGDFLFADVFPNLPRGKPMPPELLQKLGPGKLVFYHWEATPQRLKALPQLTQLALLLTRHKQLDANSAAAKWLNLIGPTSGNCVTEITETGPSELTVMRVAPTGLTAVELIALANWLEAPNFPGCDLHLPPPRFKPGQKPFKKLSAPPSPGK